MKNIIIKKEYFDNIQVAINSINDFFSSNFKSKNFPIINDDYQIEPTIEKIINNLNFVEPSWLDNPEKVNDVVQAINETIENINPVDGVYNTILVSNNKVVIDHINAYMGYKTLQYIADNFQSFGKFINGIYTFEIFTKPSMFNDVIDVFSKPIVPDEISGLDIENKIFDEGTFVNEIMKNEQIKVPDDMSIEEETERMIHRQDMVDVEILVDESVQEAAEVNYFEKSKPVHLKYNTSTGRWMISKQFEKTVNDLISALRKCDTTKDLTNYFMGLDQTYPEKFADTVMPYILSKVFSNPKKFNTDENFYGEYKKYMDSYQSIMERNGGAKHFRYYDLFSTFKSDKDGTIQFIEDFLKLNLVNNEDVAITNHSILTMFNIFDSRIYLDIIYNVTPDSVKKDKYPTEDGFVKEIRARINKNSRKVNVYKDGEQEAIPDEEVVQTSENINEYVSSALKMMGDMSTYDMMYCEHFHTILKDEISTIDDRMYNIGLSQIGIDNYIGESYDVINYIDDIYDSTFQEQETGRIPDYMLTRIKLSDGDDSSSNGLKDVPLNKIDDMVDSIDSKLSTPGELDDVLGSGFEENPEKDKHDGKTVINITNNYTNSFNRDSYNSNSHDDHSSGKTETITNTNTNSNNDSSHGKNIDSSRNKSSTSKVDRSTNMTNEKSSNSKYKSNVSTDTYDSAISKKDGEQKLSSGLSVQEMFIFLESKEPPSSKNNAGNLPKDDLLTTAMDNDRKTLSKQQGAKRAVQKIANTGSALLKPITRTRQWLTKVTDSLIKRDEDRVKAEIIESPNYRTSLYKAMRLALKLGLTGVAFTISGYLGATYIAIQGLKIADKHRLRKEVQEECLTELSIIDEKISDLKNKYHYDNDPNAKKQLYELMRLRSKMQHMIPDSMRQTIKHPNSMY